MIKNKHGGTAIEYALIAFLIGTVCIVAMAFLGTELTQTYSQVGSAVGGATESDDSGN